LLRTIKFLFSVQKSAERKAKEEAALRASIAVARAKLAAKKRREARKKLAMWEQEPSP
jgi:hypothetical protein